VRFGLNQLILSDQELLSEWKRFIHTGSINPAGLNGTIAQSWKRSVQAGVDPYQNAEYVKYVFEPDKLSHQLSVIVSISYPIVNETFNIH